MVDIRVGNWHGKVDELPQQCPRCFSKIAALPVWAVAAYVKGEPLARVVFQCPNNACLELFIGNYRQMGHFFELYEVLPWDVQVPKHSDIIRGVSKNYCEIFDEASKAEQLELLQICGVGYRKALEFLIKDYATQLNPDNEAKIKGKLLAQCIKEDIHSTNVQHVAKRAAWLGNDETHYVRRWETKDLSDLKKMIELTVSWIETEERTKQALAEMPE